MAKAIRIDTDDYTRRVAFHATQTRVFDAITTLDGLRGWWTTRVSGSTVTGGELHFEFEGLDEYIVMRVDHSQRPYSVHWSCMVHTALDEWNGTTLTFDLAQATPESCDLNFRHTGLTPRLECYDDCKLGWEYFLASLTAYVETGKGTPFGA